MRAGAAVLLILGSSGITALLAFVVRRSVALEVRRRHHEVGTAVFLQLGVIFAVLLAFVFNEVWGGYNEAASAINGECGNLHGTAILADTLPSDARVAVLGAEAAYLRSVIDEEWPVMRHGHSSAGARTALTRLWQSVARLELPRRADQMTRGQMMTMLAAAHQQRETRMFQMNAAVPPILWAVLALLTVVLIAFVVFSGMDYLVSQIVFSALFAGSVVMILVVIRMLDHPFAGMLALSPADFRDTLDKLALLTGAG